MIKKKKVAALCKKTYTISMTTRSDGTQWVGNGMALYSMEGMPKMTPEEVAVAFDYSDTERAAMKLNENSAAAVLTGNEYPAEILIMIHTVKCYPEFFKVLADGSKPFEVRKNDRPYETGDFLAVNEFLPEEDPYTIRSGTADTGREFARAADGGYYSGKCVLFRITYVLDDPRFCKDGMVVLGLARQIIQ